MYNNTMDKTLASEDTGLELLYRQTDLLRVPFTSDVVEQFNKFADELELEHLVSQVEHSKDFNIPQHYKELDVEEYVKRLVPNAEDQTDKLAYLKE